MMLLENQKQQGTRIQSIPAVDSASQSGEEFNIRAARDVWIHVSVHCHRDDLCFSMSAAFIPTEDVLSTCSEHITHVTEGG